MKLSELRERLNSLHELTPRHDEDEVVIVLAPGGMGGSNTIDVKSVTCGIDWDRGKLLIHPEIDLIKSNKQ